MLSLLLLTATTLLAVICTVAGLRLHKMLQQQSAQIVTLQNQLVAICAGAVGTDDRIQNFEQTLHKIKEYQNTLAATGASSIQSYEHAIRLARKGINTERLIDNCNLSEEEAHLINRLHGTQHTDLH